MEKRYNKTLYACFTGYIIQAVINNFVPLLFLTFQNTYAISLSKITMLATINFVVQLVVDLLSVTFVDRIGYRASTIIAHICSAMGLIGIAILPDVMADPFIGILLAVLVYAVGGGLLEVLVSPMVEACPTKNKEKAMSLLHSFYCFGQVMVVLVSTLFFAAFGIENWKLLALIWAVIPIINGICFFFVPIETLIAEGESGNSLHELFHMKVFWVMMVLMLCAGASEMSVSQWASTFAEQGLGVSKTIGDLAGPMSFAVFMGIARVLYGKYGERIPMKKFMMGSGVLCVLSYLMISLVPHPIVGLTGCALCGFSVGIMWPGTFSLASAAMRRGGTMLFAFLALAGDVGCMSGPTIVGEISSVWGDNLRFGILCALIFPVLIVLILWIQKRKKLGKMEVF